MTITRDVEIPDIPSALDDAKHPIAHGRPERNVECVHNPCDAQSVCCSDSSMFQCVCVISIHADFIIQLYMRACVYVCDRNRMITCIIIGFASAAACCVDVVSPCQSLFKILNMHARGANHVNIGAFNH